MLGEDCLPAINFALLDALTCLLSLFPLLVFERHVKPQETQGVDDGDDQQGGEPVPADYFPVP